MGGGEHRLILLSQPGDPAYLYPQPFYGGWWFRHGLWGQKNLGPNNNLFATQELYDHAFQSLCRFKYKMWPMRLSISKGYSPN